MQGNGSLNTMNWFAEDEGAQQAVTEIPSLLQMKEMAAVHVTLWHCYRESPGWKRGKGFIPGTFHPCWHTSIQVWLLHSGYKLQRCLQVQNCYLQPNTQQGQQEQLFRLMWLNVSPFKKVINFWPKAFFIPSIKAAFPFNSNHEIQLSWIISW